MRKIKRLKKQEEEEMKNQDNEKILKKAKELATLLFENSEKIDQVCINVIKKEKNKRYFDDSERENYKIDGLCFKKKDILPDKMTKTKKIIKEKIKNQSYSFTIMPNNYNGGKIKWKRKAGK